jgi:hypothetical protein
MCVYTCTHTCTAGLATVEVIWQRSKRLTCLQTTSAFDHAPLTCHFGGKCRLMEVATLQDPVPYGSMKHSVDIQL